MGKYRIIEGTYQDQYGNKRVEAYYIQKRKSFLGFEYWKYQTHEECGWGDCYNVRTQFKTYEDALKFIKNYLCGRDFKEGWSYKVINEFGCNE